VVGAHDVANTRGSADREYLARVTDGWQVSKCILAINLAVETVADPNDCASS
jgi:hypothetical protein